jgi:hypothetical protein
MKRILGAGFAAALLAAACTDPIPNPTPTPAVPTITETFTGSLTANATNSHPFVVQQVGSVAITLTNVDPLAQLTIGIGTPSTTTGLCIAGTTIPTAPGSTPQITGTATLKGPYCIAVSDTGNITETTQYSVTVLHP